MADSQYIVNQYATSLEFSSQPTQISQNIQQIQNQNRLHANAPVCIELNNFVNDVPNVTNRKWHIYYFICSSMKQFVKYYCSHKDCSSTIFLTGYDDSKGVQYPTSYKFLKFLKSHTSILHLYGCLSVYNQIINAFLAQQNSQQVNCMNNPDLSDVQLVIGIEKNQFMTEMFLEDFQKKINNNNFSYSMCYTDLREVISANDMAQTCTNFNMNIIHFYNCIFRDYWLTQLHNQVTLISNNQQNVITIYQKNNQKPSYSINNLETARKIFNIDSQYKYYEQDIEEYNFQRITIILDEEQFCEQQCKSILQTIIKTYERTDNVNVTQYNMIKNVSSKCNNIIKLQQLIQQNLESTQSVTPMSQCGIVIQMSGDFYSMYELINLFQSQLIECANSNDVTYKKINVKYFLLYMKVDTKFSYLKINLFNYIHGVVILTKWSIVECSKNRNDINQPIIIFKDSIQNQEQDVIYTLITNFKDLIQQSYANEIKYHLFISYPFRTTDYLKRLFKQDRRNQTTLTQGDRMIINDLQHSSINDFIKLVQNTANTPQPELPNRYQQNKSSKQLQQSYSQNVASEILKCAKTNISKVSTKQNKLQINIQNDQENSNSTSDSTCSDTQNTSTIDMNNVSNQIPQCSSLQTKTKSGSLCTVGCEASNQLMIQKYLDRELLKIQKCFDQSQQSLTKQGKIKQDFSYANDDSKQSLIDIFEFMLKKSLAIPNTQVQLDSGVDQYKEYMQVKLINDTQYFKEQYNSYCQSFSKQQMQQKILLNTKSECQILINYFCSLTQNQDGTQFQYMSSIEFMQLLLQYTKLNNIVDSNATYNMQCDCQLINGQVQCGSSCSTVKAKMQCGIYKHKFSVQIDIYYICGNQQIELNQYCFDIEIREVPNVGCNLISTKMHFVIENIWYGEYKGYPKSLECIKILLSNNGQSMYYAIQSLKFAIWSGQYGGLVQLVCHVHFFNNSQFIFVLDCHGINHVILCLIRDVGVSESLFVDYFLDCSGVDQHGQSECKCWALCGLSHRISRADFTQKYTDILNQFIEYLTEYYQFELNTMPTAQSLIQSYMLKTKIVRNIDIFKLALTYQLKVTYLQDEQIRHIDINPYDTERELIKFNDLDAYTLKYIQQNNFNSQKPKLINQLSFCDYVYYQFIRNAQCDLMLLQTEYIKVISRDYNIKWAMLLYNKNFLQQSFTQKYQNVIRYTKNSLNNILVLSYNINSLAMAIDNEFDQYVKTSLFDVICLQEPKIKQTTLNSNRDKMQYISKEFTFTQKADSSLVAYFSKANSNVKPDNVTQYMTDVETSLTNKYLSSLFRSSNSFQIVIEQCTDKLILMNIYAPVNDDENIQFIKEMFQYVQEIEQYKGKIVILCGDFNVNATQQNKLEYNKVKNNKKKVVNRKTHNFYQCLEQYNYIDVLSERFAIENMTQHVGTHQAVRNDLVLVNVNRKMIVKQAFVDQNEYLYNFKDHSAIIFEIDVEQVMK